MPPKSFTCKVCGEEVSKRQSYQYEDGRACKTHEETMEAKTQKDERVERKKLLQEERNKRDKRPRPSCLIPSCWGCRKEGTSSQDFFARMLVSMEKVNIKVEASGEKLNYLEIMERSRKDASGDKLVLTAYPLKTEEISQICNITRADYALVSMAQAVMLCPVCALKANLKMELPHLTTEQMSNWSVVAEMSKPHLKKMALKEIAEEEKKNVV